MLEEMFPHLASLTFLNNSVLAWIITLGIAFLVYVLVYGGLRLIGRRFQRRAEAHGLPISTLLGGTLAVTRGSLFFLLTYSVALRSLTMPEKVVKILSIIAFAVAGVQIALWMSKLVTLAIQRTYSKSGKPKANAVIIDLLTRAAQFVVWSFILIAVLDNAGINVTTFIASIGIGGMAVAFALQKVLGDLFASIAIGLDKPFEVGQFISFDGNSGTVERVGIKSTHIKALTGERLVVSNSTLTDTTLRNISIMDERRVTFNFTVQYGATSDDVRKIVKAVSKIIEDVQQARLHTVHLISFGELGLKFECTYYVVKADFDLYRDVHYEISLQIMDLLNSMDVEFAVPTRKVRLDEGLRIAE